MKKAEIKVGLVYSTKTGNAARKVLQIAPQGGDGALPRPRWLGEAATAPGADELLVEYEQTRGAGIGRREIVFLSQFAVWAAKEDAGAGGTAGEMRAALEEAVIMSNDAGRAGIEWRKKFAHILSAL